jgi:hypothetical protein
LNCILIHDLVRVNDLDESGILEIRKIGFEQFNINWMAGDITLVKRSNCGLAIKFYSSLS